MIDRERTERRLAWRTVLIACTLFVIGSLATSAVAATPLPEVDSLESVQDELPPEEENAGEPTDNESDVPADTPIQNGSPVQPPVDTSWPPPTDPRAEEGGLVQGPEGNVTVAVDDEQSIGAGDATTLSLEVANEGDQEATDIVVTVQSQNGVVTFGPPAATQPTRSVVVDDLSPGDEETVTVDIAAADVDPGSYPLFATVQYRIDVDDLANESPPAETDGGIVGSEDAGVRTGGPTLLEVEIDEPRSFEVTPVTEDVPVDDEGMYEVRITNEDDEPATGVVATIEVGPPLTSDSPTAYVGTLEPGESKTAWFAVESSPDSIETTTSVALTLTYETDAGDRMIEQPESIPLSIVEAEEDTDADSIAPFVAVGIVLLLAAIWWLRRR
ncbi:COG1361 S-layer family protein [Natronorubrum halophilum]|uniref:COG1361 S-layer family protein n=1 Tax=Natronorubrum halophilum TaxID=1702106 RepID=UPI001EE7E7CC|nr:hypothetical protein [Natronorubrum halophilum]